jgi:hypothetical protein
MQEFTSVVAQADFLWSVVSFYFVHQQRPAATLLDPHQPRPIPGMIPGPHGELGSLNIPEAKYLPVGVACGLATKTEKLPNPAMCLCLLCVAESYESRLRRIAAHITQQLKASMPGGRCSRVCESAHRYVAYLLCGYSHCLHSTSRRSCLLLRSVYCSQVA